jgi:putative Ca2+/H+ antiporter (TMEM165/GDT1 family)
VGSLLAAMGLVFVAELGDKTQLVALGFGARHRIGPVLVGMAIAYAVANLLAVVVGGLLGAALPTRAIGLVGGVLFLGFAAWSLRSDDNDAGDGGGDSSDGGADGGADGADGADGGAGDDAGGSAGGATPSRPARAVVVSVAVAVFVAELGDKTQLATATLAAQGPPVLVWIGATIGIIAAGAVGVVVGRLIGARLPERTTRIGSAVLFAAFGVGLIALNW